jgi:predicted HTH transcriptional regulator
MTYLTIGCLAICFIGVANDGGVKGLNVTDELLKNVAAIRADGKIQPQPSMAVEKVSMDEGDIVNTTVGNASIWSLLKSKKTDARKIIKIRATCERD